MKYLKAKIIERKVEGETVKILAKQFSTEEAHFKVLDKEAGIFEAYVSVFGNIDSYGEIVDPGAFKGWLEKYGGRYPKGVWGHDWNEPITKTLECREDERGLYVKAQFVLEVQRAREIYALMLAGVITDFSFGFRVLNSSVDPATNLVHLTEIAIYEYSPVLVGANDQATLIGVKADGEAVEPAADPAPETEPAVVPAEGEADPAAGDTPAPATEETPEPTAAGDDAGATPGGSSDPAPEDPAPATEPGKSGVAPSLKSALATAITALGKATEALEAFSEATEDAEAETSADTSTVERRDGKGSGTTRVVKAILRDARKADKIVESIIIRAKEI